MLPFNFTILDSERGDVRGVAAQSPLVAHKLKCVTLMHATSTFIANNLPDIANQTEFLSIGGDDFVNLISSKVLNDADPNMNCLAAIAWLEYGSAAERVPFVRDIVNVIPLTSSCLSLATIEAVHECELLHELAPETLRKLTGRTFKKMKVMQTVAIASRGESWSNTWHVMGGDGFSQLFYRYDIFRGCWSKLRSLPWPRKHFGACAVGGNRLLAIGGLKCNQFSRDIDEYDLSSKTWSASEAKLLFDTTNVTALTDGQQQVYMLGGTRQTCIEFYNCKSKMVTKIADMNRFYSAAVYGKANANHIVYVAGGYEHGESVNSIDKYDILNDKWSKVGKLLTKDRGGLGATLAGDDLYLMGGEVNNESVNSVEIFNIRTGQSRAAPNMLQVCDGFRATTICDNVVCAVGGRNCDKRPLTAVETYDVREGKWTTGSVIPNMPTPASYFGFAAL